MQPIPVKVAHGLDAIIVMTVIMRCYAMLGQVRTARLAPALRDFPQVASLDVALPLAVTVLGLFVPRATLTCQAMC